MADYYAFSRTNYFRVTDVEKLKEIVEKVGAELFEGENNTFAFGEYEDITSYYDEDLDEEIEIFNELQPILPDGEALIFKEVGYEKLRYVSGYVIVVTNKEVKSTNLDEIALKLAAEVLGVEKFETQMSY